MSSEAPEPAIYFGKKVFFLHPHSVIQNEMISELIKNEYEIYLLQEHAKAIRLFRTYPNSIVFINIDDGMKEPEWEAFVKTLQSDDDLRSLGVGILTYNNNPELAQKYLMDLMVSCGFIKLSLGLKESTSIILKVLEANEAKGRRKFLRVKIPEGQGKFNMKNANGDMVEGVILDISSVGMACRFPRGVSFQAHSLLSNLQLKLKGVLCMVSAITMGTREEYGEMVYILLFDAKISQDSRQKIRIFMQQTLQSSIEQEIRLLPE